MIRQIYLLHKSPPENPFSDHVIKDQQTIAKQPIVFEGEYERNSMKLSGAQRMTKP